MLISRIYRRANLRHCLIFNFSIFASSLMLFYCFYTLFYARGSLSIISLTGASVLFFYYPTSGVGVLDYVVGVWLWLCNSLCSAVCSVLSMECEISLRSPESECSLFSKKNRRWLSLTLTFTLSESIKFFNWDWELYSLKTFFTESNAEKTSEGALFIEYNYKLMELKINPHYINIKLKKYITGMISI